MNLGDIIRVLEVPATIPAETAPHSVPEPAPSEPTQAPAKTVLYPIPEMHCFALYGRRPPWAR